MGGSGIWILKAISSGLHLSPSPPLWQYDHGVTDEVLAPRSDVRPPSGYALQPYRSRAEKVAGSCLGLSVCALALVMYWFNRATILEAASFVTGAACVWLTVKESVWNFPISLLNVATFCVVYFRVKLYADASLQIVYFILTAVGWHLWLYGGAERTALHIGRATRRELAGVGLAGGATTLALWLALSRLGGSASFFDALTTSLSLCAQWLLNRKRLENWIFWIAADLVYIPLYIFKGLNLTAILYAVFLAMCVVGLRHWRAASYREAGAE